LAREQLRTKLSPSRGVAHALLLEFRESSNTRMMNPHRAGPYASRPRLRPTTDARLPTSINGTLRARPCPSRAITYAHFLLLARRSRAAARRLRHDTSLVSSRRCCRSSVDHKSTVARGSDQRMQKGQPRIRNSSVCCSRSVRARRRVVCLSGESLGFAGCPVQPKLPETPFPGSCFFFFLVVSSRPMNGDALMLP
jgi:hypothetical protein